MRRAYEVLTSSFSHLLDTDQLALSLRGSLNVNNFVSYGNSLVELNPLWKWSGKTDSMFDPNLPEDNQFLYIDNVQCLKPKETETTTHGSWVVSEPLDDGEPDNLEEDDPESKEETSWRSYSLSITYDRYNETARLWLRGFNQFSLPLSKEEMFEDVPEMYIGKTVTVERHPFTGLFSLTVHPCNQSEIVKSEKQNFGDKNMLVNYLKMWSSVFPLINVLEGFQN